MTADLRDGGLGAYEVVLRLVETADRLHDLATESEEAHRYADAVRASLAEARSLHLLLDLGVNGQREVDYAADAAALEAAVVSVVARFPNLGDELADELAREKRHMLSDKLRVYVAKCREHQVSRNNQQEVSA